MPRKPKAEDQALIPLKCCPKCGGRGVVPILRNGRYELAVQASRAWARALDMKAVVVKEMVGPWPNRHEVVFPGVVRARVAPGGWGELRVYTLKPVNHWDQKEWDDNRGDYFPYTFVSIGWSGRDCVAPLVSWEEGRELERMVAALALGPG